MDPGQPDIHRQPAAAPGQADDRRSVMVGCLEPSGVRMEHGDAVEADRLEAEPADVARRRPLDGRGATHRAPVPSGPEQPLLAGDGVEVGARLLDRDRDRPDCLRPVDRDERAPLVGNGGDPIDRQRGRPSSKARATAIRALSRAVIAASKAATVRSSSPPSPMSAKTSSTPNRSRTATSGPRPPACSWVVVTARSPGRQSTAHVARFIPSVVAWVMAIESTSAPRIAAMPARASRHPLEEDLEVVGMGATGAQLPGRDLLGSPPRTPPGSDPRSRCSGRSRPPRAGSASRTAASFSASGMNGATTAV